MHQEIVTYETFYLGSTTTVCGYSELKSFNVDRSQSLCSAWRWWRHLFNQKRPILPSSTDLFVGRIGPQWSLVLNLLALTHRTFHLICNDIIFKNAYTLLAFQIFASMPLHRRCLCGSSAEQCAAFTWPLYISLNEMSNGVQKTICKFLVLSFLSTPP